MKAAQGILTVRGGMTSHAAAVSYTHLDVYKRQMHACMQFDVYLSDTHHTEKVAICCGDAEN